MLQDFFQLCPVIHQQAVALLNRLESGNGGFCEQRFELPPAHFDALPGDSVPSFAAENGVQAQEVVGLWSIRIVKFQTTFRVCFGPLDFLGNQLRWIKQGDATAFVGIALAHFAAPIGQAHDPGALLENQRFRHFEHRALRFAEAGIDSLLSDVTGQFQVLLLVFSDGNQIGVI